MATEEFEQRLCEAIDLKNQKRYGESAQILEELRAAQPESASVHGLLGYALWQQKDLARTVDSFRNAVKLAPASELASLGLFHALMEMGDMKSAIQEMNRSAGWPIRRNMMRLRSKQSRSRRQTASRRPEATALKAQ
jgi:predicted Zn-dependent protease